MLEEKQISLKEYPEAFNPSIVKYGDGYLLTFRVTQGVNIWRNNYIGTVMLNEEFIPIGEPQLLFQEDGGEVHGEDARIVAVGGKYYIVTNDDLQKIGKMSHLVRFICVSELKEESGFFSLTPPVILQHSIKGGLQKIEKNWSPFIWQDQLLFSYFLSPHEVVSPDLNTGEAVPICMTKCSWDWPYGEIRGGTPAEIVDGVYLAFFHSSTRDFSLLKKRGIFYFMGAYTFSPEPPFPLLKGSEYPIVGSQFYDAPRSRFQVIFPGGFIHKDPFIYVVYGKNDHEIWYAKLDKQELLQSMKELPQRAL